MPDTVTDNYSILRLKRKVKHIFEKYKTSQVKLYKIVQDRYNKTRKEKMIKAGDRMDYRVTEGDYERFGVKRENHGAIFTFEAGKDQTCAVVFYDDAFHVTEKVAVPGEFYTGNVRSVRICGLKTKKIYYNYEIDGEIVTDPYATAIVGREQWNDSSRQEKNYQIYGCSEEISYHFRCGTQPEIAKSDMIMYKLHVRGFSMDAGMRGREKGTFAAIEKQIPRLKELGVTTVELMPSYEFEELEFPKQEALPDYLPFHEELEASRKKTEAIGLNYWGYKKGFYFAPKASYSKGKNAAAEFKQLVDRMHENQLECVMEFYFEADENQNRILDILRYWRKEYRVDGFHLIGENLPLLAIAQDPFLKRTKIFAPSYPEQLWKQKEAYPHLYIYNEEYLFAGRKLINHQGGSLAEFCNQQKKQNEMIGFVNFMSNHNGFTLADVFAYNEKHNEENGEKNADGIDYNYSQNCGVEGKTSKAYVKELRKKCLRMALAMEFLGQGVPLIMAGDEAGNSQRGNNNAYCQDNKIGWVNWKNREYGEELAVFIRSLAAFRREHPVIRQEKPMQFQDYRHKGCPDISYHSENAWLNGVSGADMALGILYNGNYAKKISKAGMTDDDYVYVGYNFHESIKQLALPKLPGKKKWYLVMDTNRAKNAFVQETEPAEDQQKVVVNPQSIIILLGK